MANQYLERPLLSVFLFSSFFFAYFFVDIRPHNAKLYFKITVDGGREIGLEEGEEVHREQNPSILLRNPFLKPHKEALP